MREIIPKEAHWIQFAACEARWIDAVDVSLACGTCSCRRPAFVRCTPGVIGRVVQLGLGHRESAADSVEFIPAGRVVGCLRNGSLVIGLDELLALWMPGSHDQPWSWDDEERDILARVCLCCGEPGHYQRQLEDHFRRVGRIDQGICLGTDGRVWDGHHRIIAARRLGYDRLPGDGL